MPKWLVSRVMSSVAKVNDSENAQCGREKMKNGTCEDAEHENVKKENTKKEHEDAGNRNVRVVSQRWVITEIQTPRGTPPCLWRPWRWYSG